MDNELNKQNLTKKLIEEFPTLNQKNNQVHGEYNEPVVIPDLQSKKYKKTKKKEDSDEEEVV